jgi:2-polyprenyl-3-methyl-5-hydroxy-6-metoxy-1,4-benzoquinol methylase
MFLRFPAMITKLDQDDQGIRLSGESQDFFIEGRLRDLASQLPRAPRRILDFGCGVGKTCQRLAVLFPDAFITGVDISDESIAHAARMCNSPRIAFAPLRNLPQLGRNPPPCAGPR